MVSQLAWRSIDLFIGLITILLLSNYRSRFQSDLSEGATSHSNFGFGRHFGGR
jgi:hypothetical protein